MTFASSLTLFLSMIVLALIPGPGILVVVGRSAGAGLCHGVSTTLGIVAGDFVFITLALFGLTVLAEILGGLFFVVRYLGAAYLIFLGLSIMILESNHTAGKVDVSRSHLVSFFSGLITTLSNPKAILFYVSFFPTFLDLRSVSIIDTMIIYMVATIAIGGVMLGYAYVAYRAKASYGAVGRNLYVRYGAGSVLVSSGIYVAARS